jgi:hypothetical protein
MPGGDNKIGEWCKKNPLLCAIIVVLLIWVVWRFVLKKERLNQPFYLDQIAMQASDPTIVVYEGNERDPLGMSLRDYYLNNEMNAKNLVAPYYNNDLAFANHSDYLALPRMYRVPPGYKPRPLAALLAGDNVATTTPSTDSVNTASVDGAGAAAPAVAATEKAIERMNQKNKNSRSRFFH